MQILKPQKLNKGDIIGVIAPSGVVEAKGLETGVKMLEKWGFKVKMGKHIMKKVDDYSAGTPQERREDFENMIIDPEVKAITCAEGGYAAPSVLLALNPAVIDQLKLRPVLFFGYSDFCTFLDANFAMRITGLHAPNLVGLSAHNKETQDSLKKCLLGDMELKYCKDFSAKVLIPGTAEGYFVPTNLETFTQLFGSKFDLLDTFDGPIILGLEEVWEEKSDVRRMLERIILHKGFDKVKGIVLGRFIGDGEAEYPKWGKKTTWSQLFVSTFKDRGIPILDFPVFGHLEEYKSIFKILNKTKEIYRKNLFLSLPVGAKVILDGDSENPCLKFQDQAVE